MITNYDGRNRYDGHVKILSCSSLMIKIRRDCENAVHWKRGTQTGRKDAIRGRKCLSFADTIYKLIRAISQFNVDQLVSDGEQAVA